jgi:hypothetical protein
LKNLLGYDSTGAVCLHERHAWGIQSKRRNKKQEKVTKDFLCFEVLGISNRFEDIQFVFLTFPTLGAILPTRRQRDD